MVLSATTGSIIIQLILFLVIRGCMFFPRFDPANWLYIGTIAEFVEDLSLGTLWLIAFHEWLPGQLLVFLGLTVLLFICAFLARRTDLRFRSLILFHVSSLAWIFLPVGALEFGTYRGP